MHQNSAGQMLQNSAISQMAEFQPFSPKQGDPLRSTVFSILG